MSLNGKFGWRSLESFTRHDLISGIEILLRSNPSHLRPTLSRQIGEVLCSTTASDIFDLAMSHPISLCNRALAIAGALVDLVLVRPTHRRPRRRPVQSLPPDDVRRRLIEDHIHRHGVSRRVNPSVWGVHAEAVGSLQRAGHGVFRLAPHFQSSAKWLIDGNPVSTWLLYRMANNERAREGLPPLTNPDAEEAATLSYLTIDTLPTGFFNVGRGR